MAPGHRTVPDPLPDPLLVVALIISGGGLEEGLEPFYVQGPCWWHPSQALEVDESDDHLGVEGGGDEQLHLPLVLVLVEADQEGGFARDWHFSPVGVLEAWLLP